MKENKITLPTKAGWYWIKDVYDNTLPCWFMPDSKCFLPAGLGDASSSGIYEEHIVAVGPMIEEPEL